MNTLAAALLGKTSFKALRHTAQTLLPLPEFAVYTLPEMLWTAAFTILSGNLFIPFWGRRVSCIWIPLLISVGLELLQILPGFPGRFDWADLLGSAFAWALTAVLIWRNATSSQSLFGRPNRERFAFTACYVIMFLAHVWR